MFKSLLLLAFATSVSAFGVTGPVTVQTTTSLSAFVDYDSELGAQAPLGFWDPLNFLDDDEEKFNRYRYVELKHGRVAMLAFLGEVITRAGIHLPGTIDKSGTTFDSIPNGWAAIGAIPKEGFLQLFVFVGLLELLVMKDITGTGEFPGDFRNEALDYGWDTFDEEEQMSKRSIELSNGRAAMIGSLLILISEQLHLTLPLLGEM